MLIYVCSPLRGEPPYSIRKYNRNLKNAAEYSNTVRKEGHTPVTPHLYFSAFIDDHVSEERADGIRMGQELLRICDEVWVFAENGTSEGMRTEIELASSIGKPVRYK